MTEQRLAQITVVDKEPHELLPGEMTWLAQYGPDMGCWYLGCPNPNCSHDPILHGIANLGGHTVIKDSITGITVSPSILCGCGAHYFVRQNKIEWC